MAANARHANSAVKKTLQDETFQFDFHQAVELIQQMNPDAIPLGEGVDPMKEALQLKTRVSLSPSSAQIHSFSLPIGNQSHPILWVNFMGIAGIEGPLPTPYTEMLQERTRQNDTAFRDFLDIFNHRLLSLWHRLKKKTFISFSQKDPRDTHIGKCLLSLTGSMNQSLRPLLFVSERTLLSYHELLWRRPRSAFGLVRMLSTYYRMPVKIKQFQGAWERADLSETTKLGQQFHRLGVETILGDKLWNQSAGIRIDMGPMTWQQLMQVLPTQIKDENGQLISGGQYQALKDLILFYSGKDYRVKVRFLVHAFNVKPLRLNRRFALGHNSWLTVGRPLQKPCCVDVVMA